MYSSFKDTISAISTPRGRGAIAIIRISGEDAIDAVKPFIKTAGSITSFQARKAYFARFIDQGRLIDEVLMTCYYAPDSYTGENLVEISCHGNDFIASQILETLLKKTRMAEPGEFTLRAFLNHKMDLTRAEAVGNLLMAQTGKAQKASLMQLEGKLEKKINALLKQITDLRVQCELAIDFIEDEVPVIENNEIDIKLNRISQQLEHLENTGHEGMIIHEGLKICLIGEPNAGKSSIFNKILNMDRAIVSPIPGTTRDYLEEAISLDGNLIRIFDTAGIRQSDDLIEKIGIDRSNDLIRSADLVLLIIDATHIQSHSINENEPHLGQSSDSILHDFNLHLEALKHKLSCTYDDSRFVPLLNKADLLTDSVKSILSEQDILLCSALEENGLDSLKGFLLKRFEQIDHEIDSGLISNARQLSAVSKAAESIRQAMNTLKMDTGIEFIAFDLKSASISLEEIIGKISTDDILNQIFENFCIGK